MAKMMPDRLGQAAGRTRSRPPHAIGRIEQRHRHRRPRTPAQCARHAVEHRAVGEDVGAADLHLAPGGRRNVRQGHTAAIARRVTGRAMNKIAPEIGVNEWPPRAYAQRGAAMTRHE
jgi:hypothetical protein